MSTCLSFSCFLFFFYKKMHNSQKLNEDITRRDHTSFKVLLKYNGLNCRAYDCLYCTSTVVARLAGYWRKIWAVVFINHWQSLQA